MSEETRTEKAKSSPFGLDGIWSNLGNLSAIAVLLVVFYQLSSQLLAQSKEDRALFRQELRRLHDKAEIQRDIIRENQRLLAGNEKIIEANNEILKTNQQLMLQVSEALREVADELRKKVRP